MSSFAFLFLSGLYLLFHFWIKKPLALISESLRTNEMEKIKDLSANQNEFGKIGELIINYFQQSETLQKEMKARLAAKQELIDSIDRFYKIFEHSPDLILITKDSILLEANKTFWRETGYSENQLIGKRIEEIDIFPENFSEKKTSGNNILQLQTKDGIKIDILLSEETIDFEQKKCQLFMMRNITEELKIEKQLIQSHKMEAISSLAAGIAHDFNNILNVIMGYTAAIKANSLVNTEQHEKLLLIENASQRAKDLVKQIVLISRQQEPTLQEVKPKIIIQQAIKFLKPSIPSSIEIVSLLHSDSSILADPMQMHQLIINLCANSFQAIVPNSGTIEIRLSEKIIETSNAEQEKQLVIEVQDSGSGIAPGIMDKIFDPYFSTKNEQQGLGLGLAIVKGIVERCHGTIEVESRLHKGTTFTLHFPIYESEHDISSQEVASKPLKNKTVLFVEDEKELLALFQETLLDAEFDVIATHDSRKALEFFMEQQHNIDVIVTDSAMSGLSGIELIRIIRNYNQNIPIILYSGFKTKEMESAIKELHIFAFLLKPIIPQKMLQTITEAIINEEKSCD
jgi:PAS domain S-box-containing protein